MYEVVGTYNRAVIYAKTIDDSVTTQVKEMCDQASFAEGQIRIMPDCHAGKGSVVGTTMNINDTVVPNVVGVDIGCGMLTTKIGRLNHVDFNALDAAIRAHIPHGFGVNEQAHRFMKHVPVETMKCWPELNNHRRIAQSLSSLGGGNHFIEMNVDERGDYYIVIHSGSRNLGKQVAELYQNKAIAHLYVAKEEIAATIAQLKAEGRHKEIQSTIKALSKTRISDVPPALAHLSGQEKADYLFDMNVAQIFASYNRKAMMDVILRAMRWEQVEQFETIHNYIDVDKGMLRKGAVSAERGERILIPMNMRDGSIVAIGKGNDDWNRSAPHGAGRLMSRSQAKKAIDFADFEATMKDVWSTSVTEATLDESPFAYKPMAEIIQAIEPTATVEQLLKPVYNFKAN